MRALATYVLSVHIVPLVVAAALALTLLSTPIAAVAESPSPPPTPSGSPPPPKPSPPLARSPSPSPSSSPSPALSQTPTPEPSPSVAPEVEAVDAALAGQMRRVIAAASLAERIEAQRRLAAAERDVLVREIARIQAEHAAAAQRAAELQRQLVEKRAQLDRLMEETYRTSRITPLEALLRRGSVVDLLIHVDDLARLSAKQREVVDELRDVERRVAEEREALARKESDIGGLMEAVAAKDATLGRLAAWAEALLAAAERGAASDARIELLRELADAAAREHEATERVIADIAQRAGETPPSLDRWTWPLAGLVTQEFGPTSFALEPPLAYRGVTYPHFHDGVDIAAPVGAAVHAVARGRVAFVGHLGGGAMAVIVAHAEGLISLYGHLDDTVFRPTVRAGDTVEAGQRIGSVGLTGLTTGPHLHFSLRRGTEPVDPRGVLGSPGGGT